MKRGRPPKFGRPSRLVALTLPEDVVAWLHSIHADPAWAIVSLYDRHHRRTTTREKPHPDVQLASIGPRRSLIVVDQAAFRSLRAISVIPLSAGRAFLALEPGKGMADLELAVIDRLEEPSLSSAERDALVGLRRHLREWRHDPALTFTCHSIIIAERARASKRSPRTSR